MVAYLSGWQHWRAVPALLLMALQLLLSACATAPLSRQLLQQPPAKLPQHAEITQVPFFPQEEYQCGPAALATVLAYRKVAVTPAQLVPEVYVPKRQGSFQVEMVAAARARDLLVYPLATTAQSQPMQDLLTEVAAGNPVLILQNLGFSFWPMWHYAVVVGYDLEQDRVVLRSGTSKRFLMRLGVFEMTWKPADYWGIVLMPTTQLPAHAEQSVWVNAASELESVGRIQAAHSAYQTALGVWPNNQMAWLGQGNTEYALGNWQGAVHSFQQLLALNPHLASAWNNLAYALQAQGCPNSARDAVRCAAQLAPADGNIKNSLRELTSDPANDSQGPAEACSVPACPH